MINTQNKKNSDWVIVVDRQFNNFSAIAWREQANFQWNDDDVALH
jgi:hypothetical protein